MIDALDCRSKAALSQKLYRLVTIANVVTVYNFVVSIFIVVSKIELQMWTSLDFWHRLAA